MENEHPKHMVSVSAFVMNEKDEVLLLRTHWRSDTWEMPGGNVEAGEPLDQATWEVNPSYNLISRLYNGS
ncbi:NUDIX domain-containing protein [Paenibacillus dokdonensis]|uniref:NUDIX domain-containing protein n=1 Tax=Paenibacillus dokdonensis TaxID=2567944 RepID=UPI00398A7FED